MQAKPTKSGLSADKPRTIEMTLAGGFWVVAESYELAEGVIRAEGAIVGSHRTPRPEIAEELYGLRKASAGALLDWVRLNGTITSQGAIEDSLADIRRSLVHLNLCRELLRALRSERVDFRRVRWLALALGGRYTGGWERSAWAARTSGISVTDSTGRRTLRADLFALSALAEGIADGLADATSIWASVSATRWTIRARPLLAPRGPLGLAYALLLEDLAKLRVNRTNEGPRLRREDRLVRCPVCGISFEPARRDQRFDKPQCRWTWTARQKRAKAKGASK